MPLVPILLELLGMTAGAFFAWAAVREAASSLTSHLYGVDNNEHYIFIGDIVVDGRTYCGPFLFSKTNGHVLHLFALEAAAQAAPEGKKKERALRRLRGFRRGCQTLHSALLEAQEAGIRGKKTMLKKGWLCEEDYPCHVQ